MKKLFYLVLILSLFPCCGPQYEKVDKIMEDGVEVVLNHIEPYKIRGESGNLLLEREFSIDTENEDMLKIGLTDIETFDVDQDGNIFVIRWRSTENYLFKFDSKGNFIKSFMRFGQGPGEIEWGGTVLLNPQGEVMAKDPSKRKFLVYDRDGNFLRETHMEKIYSLIPLENGKYFISWQDEAPEFLKNHLAICSSEFEDIKELDTLQFPHPVNRRSVVNRDRMIDGISKDRIYIGNPERSYEIRVYDLDGNLLQKIRKEYEPVEVSEEFKKAYFERFPKNFPARDYYYFTKNWPPYRYLFTDDGGRLFIMTYEEGVNPGEYMYDIFNSDGAFIGRTSLGNVGRSFPFTVRAKNDRLYCVKEKESGYKELVVYKIRWE